MGNQRKATHGVFTIHFRKRDVSSIEQGGENVGVHHLVIGNDALRDSAFPVYEKGNAQASLKGGRLSSAVLTIVAGIPSSGGAFLHGAASVIADKDDERVIGSFQFIENVDQFADVMIHVLENCNVVTAQKADASVNCLVDPLFGCRRWLRFIGADGTVHRIVSEVAEKRLLFSDTFANESLCPFREQLGGVTCGIILLAVVQ